MALTEEARQRVALGIQLEDQGQYDLAERCYLDAVSLSDPNDHELLGALQINLGRNAGLADQQDDAIRYYLRAITYLSGLKGESLLQCAYAHYNLSEIYVIRDDPQALYHSEEALDLFTLYPFSPPSDVADAKALHVVVLAFNHRSLGLDVLTETWSALESVPFTSLREPLITQFLLIYLPYLRAAEPGMYTSAVRAIHAWADPRVVEFVMTTIGKC